jgi:hypothetical protein
VATTLRILKRKEKEEEERVRACFDNDRQNILSTVLIFKANIPITITIFKHYYSFYQNKAPFFNCLILII